MKKISKILLVFLLALALFACGKKKAVNNDRVGGGDSVNGDSAKIVIDDGRKIIYNVSYTLEGTNINDYEKKIDSKLNELNGYVESLDTKTYYSIATYRVPKAKLDDFVNYIDSFEGLVNDKNVKTTDVSTSYNSYEARKEVLEASRATYVAMLSKDGLTVSDIIAINDKIEKIDIELKEIYLQIDTYDGLIDYSTVTVNYYEKGEYKDPSFMEEYGNYVGEFFITIGKIILYLLPVALIGGIAAIITVVSIKHHKNKNKKKLENSENKKEE